jgi:hypothetical protein
MAFIRARLTYANVVSSLCLFIVLGGTSWAVASGSIDSREIKDNSISSKDVKNGSLRAGDFNADHLPEGPRGATGARGPQGPAGAAGATNVVVRSQSFTCPGNACAGFLTKVVPCASGERAVGGGATMLGDADGVPHPVASDNLTFSGPADSTTGKATSTGTPTAWLSTMQMGNSALNRTTYYYAICAKP